MSRKHEAIRSHNLFYCFVDIGQQPSDLPSVYVIPSSVVADTLIEEHQRWLHMPGSKGQQRNDGSFRRFLPDYSRTGSTTRNANWLKPYRDAWQLLTEART